MVELTIQTTQQLLFLNTRQHQNTAYFNAYISFNFQKGYSTTQHSIHDARLSHIKRTMQVAFKFDQQHFISSSNEANMIQRHRQTSLGSI